MSEEKLGTCDRVFWCHHSKQLLYISGYQFKCALCEVGELRKERDALQEEIKFLTEELQKYRNDH